MKKILISVMIGLLPLTIMFGQPKFNETKQAVHFTARGGLPNFYNKIKNNETVRIAYFGGSITEQPGWRVHSRKALQEKFPNAKFEEIFAAIGGTGSQLGAFRLKYDVINKKPDLVFVEFAVNDLGEGRSSTSIRRSMEGIVRQIWKVNPQTDICFVYTFTKGHCPTKSKGIMVRSQSAMEDVADFYKIPTVDLSIEIVELVKTGKLELQIDPKGMRDVAGKSLHANSNILVDKAGKIPFSQDGVHPYPNTGHKLYNKALMSALDEIQKVGAKKYIHKLGKPMDKLCLENAKIVEPEKLKLKGGKKCEAKSPFKNKLPHNYVYEFCPKDEIEFKFKGTVCSAYVVIGNRCGSIEVEIDGKKQKDVMLFDGYCSWSRVGDRLLFTSEKEGIHTVKIRVSENKFDKREILFPHNKPKYDKNPKHFKDYSLILGGLLLCGDIVE